jgi:hypothetical protein
MQKMAGRGGCGRKCWAAAEAATAINVNVRHLKHISNPVITPSMQIISITTLHSGTEQEIDKNDVSRCTELSCFHQQHALAVNGNDQMHKSATSHAMKRKLNLQKQQLNDFNVLQQAAFSLPLSAPLTRTSSSSSCTFPL